jgi:4-amino-4-deoxy-L-arabinose transferase-like glycosyltransferase
VVGRKGDSSWCGNVAKNLAENHAFSNVTEPPFAPMIYRPPLYPSFVAAIRLVAGDSVLPLQLIQCLLGTAAVGLMATSAACISKKLGRIALWVLALSPFDAVYARRASHGGPCHLLAVRCDVRPARRARLVALAADGRALGTDGADA